MVPDQLREAPRIAQAAGQRNLWRFRNGEAPAVHRLAHRAFLLRAARHEFDPRQSVRADFAQLLRVRIVAKAPQRTPLRSRVNHKAFLLCSAGQPFWMLS